MKVKCFTIYNEQTREYQDKSCWLTIGKKYVILEMLIFPGKDVLYRLIGDNEDEMPALYDARQFEIISDKISSNWTITQLESSRIIFGPKKWRFVCFWEDYYDLEPAALEIYGHEARIILEEER